MGPTPLSQSDRTRATRTPLGRCDPIVLDIRDQRERRATSPRGAHGGAPRVNTVASNGISYQTYQYHDYRV